MNNASKGRCVTVTPRGKARTKYLRQNPACARAILMPVNQEKAPTQNQKNLATGGLDQANPLAVQIGVPGDRLYLWISGRAIRRSETEPKIKELPQAVRYRATDRCRSAVIRSTEMFPFFNGWTLASSSPVAASSSRPVAAIT
jgi:hypothetical protein